jgi:ABC-type multidrug transport system ATPase subunit/pSer/pThr/pTyr-binding forkhead associated (FHA) protein
MSDPLSASNTGWKVGSSPACDIVLRQPTVSGEHCRLRFQDNQYVLEDLGSTNGTFVNGFRLTPQTPVYVSPADQIMLGSSVAFPWPTQRNNAAPSPATQTLNIGRGPQNEIRLDYPMISWNHARITREGNQWIIEDLNSSNGTALNRIDNKIRRAVLDPADEIYLGSYKVAASRILREKKFTQGEGQFERVRFKGDRMVLGRDPQSDYPLNFPMISWRHAAVERTSDGIYVEDLGSRNGTYVNGVRISGRTLVRPGEDIGLGSFHFMLLEDGALAKREYIGNVTIEVASVAIDAPNGTRLLDSVSLCVFPSELVALMGPAGAGKTTFLKAVNGYTAPASGKVLFNGDDLYQFYDRFRLQMSYVPQDDIVHAQLTVREALYFTAKLRTDLTDPEIEQRIDAVLKQLDLQDKKNTIIGSPERKVLSGGQRKRVNIAMELIAEAPVVFLDEPTSGLSSYDAENVVKVLKKLSEAGTTVITTIHQPSLDIYKQFDSLIMISRDRGGTGALAYFGPAYPDAIEFFNPGSPHEGRTQETARDLNPEMLLSGLAKKTTTEWVSNYAQSRYQKLFVAERSGKVPSTQSPARQSTSRGFGFGQWWTLVRRNYLLKARDRAQSAILLVQAPLFGFLLGLVFKSLEYSNAKDWGHVIRSAPAMHFLMVIAAVWFGCNNVARDIVGEWTVFQRERMVSLKLPSYLFSKLTIAAVLCLFQCLTLSGIVALMCHLKGDYLLELAMLYLSSLVGAAIGLCVSARASTTEAAIAMLPLILLPVIALGGGLTPIHLMNTGMQQVAKAVPSRWAYEANLLTEAKGFHYVPGSKTDDPPPAPANKQQPTPPPFPPECYGEDVADTQFPVKEYKQIAHADCPVPPANAAPNPSPSANDKDFVARTPLRASFAILGAMFVFWTAIALLFLRMRDVH